MFGIGFGELILLLVIALIVFGPEKLPEVAKTFGKFYRQVKDYTDSLRETVERELSIEDLKKINNIPEEVSQLVLPREEVEKRKREVMERLKKQKLIEAEQKENDNSGSLNNSGSKETLEQQNKESENE